MPKECRGFPYDFATLFSLAFPVGFALEFRGLNQESIRTRVRIAWETRHGLSRGRAKIRLRSLSLPSGEDRRSSIFWLM